MRMRNLHAGMRFLGGVAALFVLASVFGAGEAHAQPAGGDVAKAEAKPYKKPTKVASKTTKSTKTAAKPAPAKPKKNGKKPLSRKPGSDAGEPDDATRRIIAGTSNAGAKTAGHGPESAELRAMRELDLALFPNQKA